MKNMKSQARIHGQISGQVPNQAMSQLPVLSQPNGNTLPPQMSNLGGVSRSANNMDLELLRTRSLMQEKIFNILMRNQPLPVSDLHMKKFKDLAKRLEEGLFKTAITKEDYTNMDTLESRLFSCIRRPSPNHHNQQYPQMIPTPGMSHIANSSMGTVSSMDGSMIAASGCHNVAPTSVNAGSMLPSSGMHGAFSNGYQQPSASFSIGSGGKHVINGHAEDCKPDDSHSRI